MGIAKRRAPAVPSGLGLDRVIECERAIPIAERLADLLAAVTRQQHDALKAGLGQLVEQVSEKRLAKHFGEDFGPIADDAAQPRAEPAGKNRTDHLRHAAPSASAVGQAASLPLHAEKIPRSGKLATRLSSPKSACPTSQAAFLNSGRPIMR